MGRRWCWCAALLWALCAWGARADTLECRHASLAELREEVPNPGTALEWLEATDGQPEGAVAPHGMVEWACSLTIPLGEGPQLYTAAYDPWMETLYFDTDGDGDLADEEPVEWQLMNGGDCFGPIVVSLTRNGRVGPYYFYIARFGTQQGDHWRLIPGCYNVGEVRIGDAVHRMAATDGAANGVFNDLWSADMYWSDHSYVDWDDDGVFEANESLYCTRRYLREGRWYDVSFSSDGLEVSFTPAVFPMGAVTFTDCILVAQFVSDLGNGGFIAEGRGRIEVPVDEYRILRCWVKEDDEEGVRWEASGSRKPAVGVLVEEGGETPIPTGPPFAAIVTRPDEDLPWAGRLISFEVQLCGADGKTYQFRRGTKQMPAPSVVARNEAGEELGTPALADRGDGTYLGWMEIPAHVKGKGTLTPVVETGPFECRVEELVVETR